MWYFYVFIHFDINNLLFNIIQYYSIINLFKDHYDKLSRRFCASLTLLPNSLKSWA